MDSLEIQTKKVLLAGLYSKNPSNPSISKLIQDLLFLSKSSQSNTYISEAAQYIIAHLKLGFGYLEHKELFDYVLLKSGTPAD